MTDISVKGYVMIMMGLVGGLLSILAVNEIYGGVWSDVATAVTSVILFIAFLAVILFYLLAKG